MRTQYQDQHRRPSIMAATAGSLDDIGSLRTARISRRDSQSARLLLQEDPLRALLSIRPIVPPEGMVGAPCLPCAMVAAFGDAHVANTVLVRRSRSPERSALDLFCLNSGHRADALAWTAFDPERA